ncbi:Copia protein, partial [Durusdinium trenchii]
EEDELLKTRRRDKLGDQDLWPPRVRPLGHPSLRWLSFSGCKSLRCGLDHLPRCTQLHYVDLFGCPEVDAFSCFVASSDQVQLVWPSVEQLLTFAQRAAVPEQRTLELLEAAVKAVEEKKRQSSLEEPENGLLSMQKLVRNAAREAAATATLEIGVRELRPPKVVRSIFPEVMTDTEEDDEKSEALSESEPEKVPEPRGKVGECIRPWAFVRKLKADGFKPGTALQGTRLFRVLDEDRDGLISKEEFSILEVDFAGPEEINEAIGCLLKRHEMIHDVVARDLAGKRSKMDKKRLVECMVIAGVEEEMAGHAARCLLYCSRAMGRKLWARNDACKAALQHGLGASVIVYTLKLLESLQKFLQEKCQGMKQAFQQLDVTGRRRIAFEDFESGMKDLDWPESFHNGILEVMFRVLDRDATGAFLEKDFAAFEHFSYEKTLEALVRVGRNLVKFPKERPDRLVKVKLDLLTVADPSDTGIGRSSFVEAWKEFGSKTEEADGKMVFGILDFDDMQRIYLDRLLVLVDALPRRSEFFGLAKLKAHLQKTHGSLQAAFVALADSELPSVLGQAEEKPALQTSKSMERNRRVSF